MIERTNEPSLYKMPLPLPAAFLSEVGYAGDDDLIGIFWDHDAGEMVVYDQSHLWRGQHCELPCVEYVDDRRVRYWLGELCVELGLKAACTHHLLALRERGEVYVAEAHHALKIVARQWLGPEDFLGVA